MTSEWTTHLICVPELAGHARVQAVHVGAGTQVGAETLLVTLLHEGGDVLVLAPEGGQISKLVALTGEQVETGDLLLMMEIEEKPIGFGLDGYGSADIDYQCLDEDTDAGILKVTTMAAHLAARLGLDLSEVAPGPQGVIDEEALFAHARGRLK